MKRDLTVIIALVGFLVSFALLMIWDVPRVINSDAPMRSHVLFWSIFACAIRGIILWFETLIHSVKTQPVDRRVQWVVSHVFLGPIASLTYYFTTKVSEQESTTQPSDGSAAATPGKGDANDDE